MAARRSARPGTMRANPGAAADRAHHREQGRGAELSSPAVSQGRADRRVSRREGEELRLRPSRIAREEGGSRARALRRLSAEVARRGAGSRRRALARRGGSALPSSLLQRSLVKVSYTANRGGRSWRAHGHYLGRKGAQREGERGVGFDAEREDVYLPDRLDGWQRARDPRMWKLVVSPEAGERVDLWEHARELVSQMESDLGTRLEWTAIDHHDTDHPHVHIAIRGVDDRGRPLTLPREYVRSGIRARSQALLTKELGYRHERDRRLGRERSVLAPRMTEIDRALLGRAGASRELTFDSPPPAGPRAQERRLQDLRRLHHLAGLGLAEQTGPRTWRLSPDLEAGLRQLQIAGDVQKSLARSRALVTDWDAPIQVTRLEPGASLLGRVAGAGLDESRDEPFLIVEGTDGVRHVVPQTAEIQRARGAGLLGPGTIATLRSPPIASPASSRARIVPHGRLRELRNAPTASTVLDLDALRWLRQRGKPPEPVDDRRGFLRQWRNALVARIPILEREGLVRALHSHRGERTHEVAEGAEHVVEARQAERERAPRSFAEIERLHGRRIHAAEAQAAERLRGELVAYAESEGRHYAVIATGRHLTAVPTDQRDLRIGQRVQARLHPRAASGEEESHERRRLAWTIDDLEHQHDHGRGR